MIISGGTITNGQYFNPDGTKGSADTPVTSVVNPNSAMPGAAVPPAITSATTAPSAPITLPTPKLDTTSYNPGVAGGNAAIESNRAFLEASYKAANPSASQNDVSTAITNFLNSTAGTPPSNVAYYDSVTGTTDASRNQAVTDAQNTANAQKSAVRAAQAEVAGIQAQIQSITDQRDKQVLQLEQTINQNTTGAGGAGGIASGSFLNVRQQEINRQAAVQALPLQGLALAAQAKLLGLQGLSADAADVLAAAQKKFDQAFQLKIDDNNRLYDAQKENRKAIYDFLTAQQKTISDRLDKQQVSNVSAANNAINDASQKANALLGTQPDLASQINAIPHPNPTSATFQQDIQTYNDKVSALLAKVVAKAVNPQTQVVESKGRRLLIDQATGNTIKDLGDAGGNYVVTDENGQTVQYQKNASGAIVPSSRTVLGGTAPTGTNPDGSPKGLNTGTFEYGTPEYVQAAITSSSQYGDKRLLQDERKNITSAKRALGSLELYNQALKGTLDNSISKETFGDGTGVIKGRLRTLASVWGGDPNAAAVNAIIQGIIPTIARGIFQEVGVLTDADIANYKKVVPNIDKPENANKLIELVLLKTLERTYADTLLTAAQNQTNVSNFKDEYNNITSRISKLIGVSSSVKLKTGDSGATSSGLKWTIE